MAVGLTLMVLSSPGRTDQAWVGLASPLRVLRTPWMAPLEVRPGDTEVLRGTPLEIQVRAPGRTGVSLEWRSPGRVPEGVQLPVVGGLAEHRFQEVPEDMEYWVEAPDGAATRRFRVEAVDPLFLSGLTLELRFPRHTGRPPEEYRSEVPPLVVPAGTRFRVRGRASRVLGTAGLQVEGGGARIELDVEGPRFSGAWTPGGSGRYRWDVQGVTGEIPRELPRPLDITVVPDSPPEVEVVFPGRDTLLPLNLRQVLVVEARDDYGLDRLELEAYRAGFLGERGEPVEQGLDAAGSRSLLARPVLDVSAWGLLPGDTVWYRVRAVDNGPRPQDAATRWFTLRLPGISELRSDVGRRLEETAGRVADLARKAAEAEERTRDLGRRTPEGASRPGQDPERPSRATRARRDMSFRQREELGGALERQEELLNLADSIGRSLSELSRSMTDAGALDPELRKDLAELAELVGEVATPELRERLQEMARALDQRDLRRARESLARMAQDQGEMRQRLERSLERFRRASAEQRFRAASSRARELARQQDALSGAMEEGEELSRRAQEQEALEVGARQLEEEIRELQERLDQMSEEEALQGARSAESRSAEARRAMSRAARSARTSRPREAAREGAMAGESLSRTAEALEQSGMEMSRRWGEEVGRALRGAVEDALALARRQEELRRDPRAGGPPRARADLRADQAAVRQGVEDMARRLGSLSQLSPRLSESLSALMGRALAEMDEVLEQMARESLARGQGSGSAEDADARQAIRALNRVALEALAAGGQQRQGQGASASRSLQEELEALAQQQGELVREGGSLLSLQLGGEAMARQLQQMSRDQQGVAGALGELSRRQQQGREGALGDLEALALEAEELAEGLEGGRLDPQVLRRQERLFRRLLDAGRSLEKDEFSDRRESASAEPTAPRDVAPLTPEDLGALSYPLPGLEALESLPPAQRALVLEYFRRLNRPGGAGGGR